MHMEFWSFSGNPDKPMLFFEIQRNGILHAKEVVIVDGSIHATDTNID